MCGGSHAASIIGEPLKMAEARRICELFLPTAIVHSTAQTFVLPSLTLMF